MKHILKTYMLVVLIAATSCSDQLDLYPRSAVSADSELTEDDVESFLIGVYSSVQNDPGRESYIFPDLLGGDLNAASATNGAGTNVFISNLLRPEHGYVAATWRGYYSALYQVNTLISALGRMTDTPRRRQIEGVAHYFRAYIYYNLVTKFGAVPLLKENTLEKPARTDVATVWQFVEEELAIAIAQAPGFSTDLGGDFYFVSREAAQALMARIKLIQGKKAEAAALAEEVIASPSFRLDRFDKIFRGAANTEILFAFRNQTAESNINMSTLFYTYAHPQSGSYVYKPNPAAMTMFEAGDLRADISVDTYEGLDVVNKYPSGQQGTDPLVVTRLAELYLISAEAQGLAGIGRLNELRAARGLDPVSASSDEEVLDLVLEERRRELFAEGFRWLDLVRTGKAKAVLGIQDREVLMPIPETELLLNKNLEQNDGY
jgi:hypothetical protein